MLNSLHGEIPRLKVDSVERAYAEHKKYRINNPDVSDNASKVSKLVPCLNPNEHALLHVSANINNLKAI